MTAVLVAHDGDVWLPRALAALAEQSRAPDVVVAVDTSSTDRTAELLRAAVGECRVLVLPRGTGFAEAVRAGVQLVGARSPAPAQGCEPEPGEEVPEEFLWLLHDDAAPMPDVLEVQLATAAAEDIAVVGAKQRGWVDDRRLLEVGVTIARSGRRETGLDRVEMDQGQHDGLREVLGVSTSAMLVRRGVWDDLGGLDGHLRFFRDDVDFGWRAHLAGHRVVCQTSAVVRHVEAAARGRRPVTALRDRPHRLDRRNALYVLLANLPLTSLPLAFPRLVLASLFRCVLLLLGKLPGVALDELLALLGVLLRPDRLVAGRWWRRRTRTLPARSALPLLAPRGVGTRHAVESVRAVLSGARRRRGSGEAFGPVSDRYAAVETGPVAPEAQELPAEHSAVLRALTRPGCVVVAVLTVLALVASRDLLGVGRLVGGASLPAPAEAGQLWATYLASWHPVGLGSAVDAPSYLAVLAVLSLPVLGSVDVLVEGLFLLAVPLSGASAWVLLSRLTDSRTLQAWGAVTYALLPPVTVAVATGRLGAVVLAVVAPLVAAGVRSSLRRGPRRSAWPVVVSTGLGLAVAVAFVPVTYPLAGACGLLAGLLLVRGWGLARLVVILAVPPLVLLPLTLQVVADPRVLLREPGLPVPAPGLPDALGLPPQLPLVLLDPGGRGPTGLWLMGTGLLLVALVALLRARRRPAVLAAWTGVVVGLGAAVALSRLVLLDPATGESVPGWPGPALLLAGGGMVVAGILAGEGAAARLRGRLHVLQPVVVLVALAAVSTPLFAAGAWVGDGAGDPLDRVAGEVLPAYVLRESEAGRGARTLVVAGEAGSGAGLGTSVLRDAGPRLGDAEVATVGAGDGELAAAVAVLASGSGGGGDPLATLRDRAVGFVLLPRPVDAALAGRLDGEPGLARVSSPDGDALWRLDDAGPLLRVDGTRAGSGSPVSGPEVVAVDGSSVVADLAAGGPGRRLVLAERADPGWVATLDGEPLAAAEVGGGDEPDEGGWAQTFVLPPEGGRLVVSHRDERREQVLWAQLGLVVLVLLAALPGARRGAGTDVAPETAPEDEREAAWAGAGSEAGDEVEVPR